MPIQVKCACGASFKVKDEMAGKKGKCPRCAGPIVVPAAAPAPELALELEPTTDVGLARPSAPPCRSCGNVYPPQILICTSCGIELATGQFVGGGTGPAMGRRPGPSAGRAPVRTRASQVEEEKSFFKIVLQAFYNPIRAFDNVGYYLISSPTNVALTIGLFFAGLGGMAVLKAKQEAGAFESQEDEGDSVAGAAAGAEGEGAGDAPPPKKVREAHAEDHYFRDDTYKIGRDYWIVGDENGRIDLEIWITVHQPLAGDEKIRAKLLFPAGEVVDLGDAFPFQGMQTYDFETTGVKALEGIPSEKVPFELVIDRVKTTEAGEQVVLTTTYPGRMEFEKPIEEQMAEMEAEADEAMREAGIEPSSRAERKTKEMASFGAAVALQAGMWLVFTAVLACVIDVIGRYATGASRFLAMAVSLVLVQGVVGLLSIGVMFLFIVGIPLSLILLLAFFLLVVWKYVLLGLAVANVYDTGWFGVLMACFVAMTCFWF